MRISNARTKLGVVAVMGLLGVGASIVPAQASTSAHYIGYGYANNKHAVWCVQHLTNDVAQVYGHHRPLAEDGIWGKHTYNWVRWFQGVQGLKKDGIVGKSTGGYLLYDGDQYYGGKNYCYKYLPSYY